MYALNFWLSWVVVALLTWFLVTCAALGVNEVAVYIAQLVEPYV